MALVNLEPICARHGMYLVGEDIPEVKAIKLADRENVITRALGVLVENGIYAMTVFLMSSNKPKYDEFVLRGLAALLADKDVALLPDRGWKEKSGLRELLEAMRGITEDLPRLLLARKIMEGALTFARYHCKALKRLEGNRP